MPGRSPARPGTADEQPGRAATSARRRRIMARSYATVGQMLTYAVDRSEHAPGLSGSEPRPRAEMILRHMLEFVLMAPRSRSAFLRTVARTELTTGNITARSEEHTSELQSR